MRIAEPQQAEPRAASTARLLPRRAGNAAALLALQRHAGNRAVAALVAARPVLARTFTAKDFKRPNFSSAVYDTAVRMHNLRLRAVIDVHDPGLSTRNLAVPHRFSWKALRDNTLKYLNEDETQADFERWTDRMLTLGGRDVRRSLERRVKKLKRKRQKLLDGGASEWDDEIEDIDDDLDNYERILTRLAASRATARHARTDLIALVRRYRDPNDANPPDRSEVVKAAAVFLAAMNNYYPNVPDLGPHRGVNNPVRERMHLNVLSSGQLSPFSARMLEMTPGRSEGIAVDEDENLVTTSGRLVDPTTLEQDAQDLMEDIGTTQVNYKVVPFDFGTT